ncbi:MAG: sodium:solute symporter family protein [Candidatus Methanofastidiosia archaeon]|jgi:SSS family solute:Na+ symporter
MNDFTVIFGAYIVLLIAIGVYTSKNLKNLEDFLVAGRKLNIPLTSASLMATWTGAAAITGYAGWIYEAGYSMIWIAVATTTSLLLIALVLSKKLNRLSVLTIPDILEKTYDKRTKKVGAFLISVYCIGIVSGELLGGSYIMSAVLNWNFSKALILISVIIMGYCILGGLWAVATTDLVQFFFLAGGLIAAVLLTLKKMGGWIVLHEKVSAIDPVHLDGLGYTTFDVIIAWIIIIYASNFIAPDIYQRMYAAKTERTARLSMGIAGVWDVFLTVAALVLGLSAFVYFQGGVPTDLALPQLLVSLFPGVFGSFLMVALLAVIMSTADSLLVVAGGTVYHDILELEKKSALPWVRAITLACGGISLGLCFYFESIMDSILFSSSVYAAGLFIPIISVFVWNKGTKDAAFYSCVSGGAITILWRISNYQLNPVIPGIAASILVFWGISFYQLKLRSNL